MFDATTPPPPPSELAAKAAAFAKTFSDAIAAFIDGDPDPMFQFYKKHVGSTAMLLDSVNSDEMKAANGSLTNFFDALSGRALKSVLDEADAYVDFVKKATGLEVLDIETAVGLLDRAMPADDEATAGDSFLSGLFAQAQPLLALALGPRHVPCGHMHPVPGFGDKPPIIPPMPVGFAKQVIMGLVGQGIIDDEGNVVEEVWNAVIDELNRRKAENANPEVHVVDDPAQT